MGCASSPETQRYMARAGLWFVFGGVLCTIVVLLVPTQVPPETASNFFLAASGMNATLLVAIAITISSIVRRGSERSRLPRMALFVTQLSVVFIGRIASGFGILVFNPATPFDSGTFVNLARLTFVTWVIGFQLLVVGIQVSTAAEPPRTGSNAGRPLMPFVRRTAQLDDVNAASQRKVLDPDRTMDWLGRRRRR